MHNYDVKWSNLKFPWEREGEHEFRSYVHFLLSCYFFALSFPFFLTDQNGVLTGKTWSLSSQMTTLQFVACAWLATLVLTTIRIRLVVAGFHGESPEQLPIDD